MRLIFRSTITVRVCVRDGETPQQALRRVVEHSEDLAAMLALKENTFELLGTPHPLSPSPEARKLAKPFLDHYSNLHLCTGSFDGRNVSFLGYDINRSGDPHLYPVALLITPDLLRLIPGVYVERADVDEEKADSRQLLLWEDDGD